MVRNIKIGRRTSRWIARHNRKHGTLEREGVLIRKHRRCLNLADTQAPIVVMIEQGTAHCVCGATRVVFVRPVYGIDPAGVTLP